MSSHHAGVMELANTPREEKEMLMFPFSPEMGPGPQSVALACWIPGLTVKLKLRGEQDL